MLACLALSPMTDDRTAADKRASGKGSKCSYWPYVVVNSHLRLRSVIADLSVDKK